MTTVRYAVRCTDREGRTWLVTYHNTSDTFKTWDRAQALLRASQCDQQWKPRVVKLTKKAKRKVVASYVTGFGKTDSFNCIAQRLWAFAKPRMGSHKNIRIAIEELAPE